MAWFRRRPPPGLIVHTDRGSQYCGDDFQKALTGYGMRSSMSRKGDCWDNAPTESLWGRLKVGRLHGRKFATKPLKGVGCLHRWPRDTPAAGPSEVLSRKRLEFLVL